MVLQDIQISRSQLNYNGITLMITNWSNLQKDTQKNVENGGFPQSYL